MTMLSPHFALGEFACKDGSPVPHEFLDNVRRLAGQLEILRAAIGRPIVILSGYRTPEWNAGKGVAHSQHLTANAADIRVAGMEPTHVKTAVDQLMASGAVHFGGIGIYERPAPRGWLHVDLGPAGRRWRG